MPTTDQSKINFAQKLEERLLMLSKNTHDLVVKLPRDPITREYADQLNRSACSVGANYIEANESESKKDFIHKLKLSKKEAKEARYWLELINHSCPEFQAQTQPIGKELFENIRLFSAIISKLILKVDN